MHFLDHLESEEPLIPRKTRRASLLPRGVQSLPAALGSPSLGFKARKLNLGKSGVL